MGLINFGIPKEFVLFLKEEYKIEYFFETGTFKGETAKWAAQYFPKVITIENSIDIYNEVKDQLQSYNNITHLYGDSSLLLKEYIEKCEGPVILWLDAHWCGLNSFGINDQCPLLRELGGLSNYPKKDLFILIDDARLFLSPPPLPHSVDDYPNITEIIKILEQFNGFVFAMDDVIYSLPNFTKEKVNPFIQYLYEKEKKSIKQNSRFKTRLRNLVDKICR